MSTIPTEEEIKSTLRRLGVKTSNRGYSYVSYGILLTLKDKSYLEYITKNLYVDIAHNFHTSGSCVERDIRTTIESIWQTEDTALLMEICNGSSTTKRPANKKFFSLMHDYFTKISDMNANKSCNDSSVDFFCDKVGGQCTKFQDMYEELLHLREENKRLMASQHSHNENQG